VVIDDVGWWRGSDDSLKNGPYRTGIERNHVPADYQAIVDLGKSLNIKPMCAFILCEWDTKNILRGCPTSTWMGDEWANTLPVGPMEEAKDIIQQNRNHLEIGLHGIGHEYWVPGTGISERAEFGCDTDGEMRPADDIRRHLDYFGKILNMWNLGDIPTAMVPPAARYRYAPSRKGAGSVFAEFGVRHIVIPLHNGFHEPLCAVTFGVEHGMLVSERSHDMFGWNITDTARHSERLYRVWGNCIGMHWPNLLSMDPRKNSEVVTRWVETLKSIENEPGVCLGCDTAHAMSQEPYRLLTDVYINNGKVCFDFGKIDALPTRCIISNFYLKTTVPLRVGKHHKLYVPEPIVQGRRPYYLYQIQRTGSAIGAIDIPEKEFYV
jgi:hypothetical protein